MFGFGKKNEYDEDFDSEAVVSRYEGEVASADYTAESLNRKEMNKTENPFHLMVPNGKGHLTYLYHDEVIEEYEGEFDYGQYQGQGRLVWRGEVFEGRFEEGVFVG
jgi:hypothetical protein